ncbi:hypothetical protein ACFL35_16685 [Candidatus Riflebacteria bacterium]
MSFQLEGLQNKNPINVLKDFIYSSIAWLAEGCSLPEHTTTYHEGMDILQSYQMSSSRKKWLGQHFSKAKELASLLAKENKLMQLPQYLKGFIKNNPKTASLLLRVIENRIRLHKSGITFPF